LPSMARLRMATVARGPRHLLACSLDDRAAFG
jgi:hypothetical protein